MDNIDISQKIKNIIEKTKQYIDENLMPIIIEKRELLEGNLFTDHHTIVYTDYFIPKVENICFLTMNKNIKNVMEIGFNSGFSSLLMLISNPNIKITCFDIGEHSYTVPCYNKIKEDFGDRINLILGDSKKTLCKFNEKQDLIHIDGGHTDDVALSDMYNSYRLSKDKTIIIMDDYNFTNLKSLWDEFVKNHDLKYVNVFHSTHCHDIKQVFF